jgi:hypothetical protein
VIYHEEGDRTSVNKQARLQGTLALLAKFRRDLRVRPTLQAHHYYALARLYGQIGEHAKERRFLRRSLATRFRLRALARYGLSLLNRWSPM